MSSGFYEKVLHPTTLYHAWKVVKKKNAAGGVDGCSVTLFEENLKVNLGKLHQDLRGKTGIRSLICGWRS